MHLTGLAWKTAFVQLTGFVQEIGFGLSAEFVGLSGFVQSTGLVRETESDCVFVVQEAIGPGIGRWLEALESSGPISEA